MLLKLYPREVANIILLYCGNDIILQMQNDFPKLLKDILIMGQEINKIHENNYGYITKIKCSDCRAITGQAIEPFINLTELDCRGCHKITNRSIIKLTNLMLNF